MPRIPQHRGWQQRSSGSKETYKKFPVLDCGYLYYAESRRSLAAHCENDLCNHVQCRVNRSCVGTPEKSSGRPVGFLLAWLFAQSEFVNDKAAHQALARRPQRDCHLISFAERRSAREWAKKHIPEVLELERELAPGETEEPTEIAY